MKYFLFDIGNVLVDFQFERLYEIHAEHSGRPLVPFSEQDLEMRDRVEKGLIDDTQWVQYLNEARGLSWTVDDLVDVWAELFTRNESGIELFRSAIDSGVKVYTLSNIAKHHIDAIEKNWPDFFMGVTGLFLSYQIGVRKPHPDIYRHVLNKLNAAGDDCFFVDDLQENINSARSVGIHAHLFVPENQPSIRSAADVFFNR